MEKWDWEVWNEPNISYWHGTPEDYDQLYDYTVDAVKRALPSAHVGGPASTGPAESTRPISCASFCSTAQLAGITPRANKDRLSTSSPST